MGVVSADLAASGFEDQLLLLGHARDHGGHLLLLLGVVHRAASNSHLDVHLLAIL